MCTVTWIIRPDSYDLLFNRDELRNRQPARTPSPIEKTGQPFALAPTDGQAGGTWIGVNRTGLCVALLNHYPEGYSMLSGLRSRGHLVRKLLLETRSTLSAHVRQDRMKDYPPFRLFAAAPDGVRAWIWDGAKLTPEPPLPRAHLCSTSGYHCREVVSRREESFEHRFAKAPPETAEQLWAYHQGEGQNHPSAYSVCMHRDDACTVSFTHIRVDKHEVLLRYGQDHPCRLQWGHLDVYRLPRGGAV